MLGTVLDDSETLQSKTDFCPNEAYILAGGE